MKSLLLSILLFATTSQAADLLTCNVGEKDLTKVVITEHDGQLFLTETFKSNMTSQTTISQEEFQAKRIRLSDGPMGFRHLTYTYSDLFGEFGWFVESNDGLNYSISRADCR